MTTKTKRAPRRPRPVAKRETKAPTLFQQLSDYIAEAFPPTHEWLVGLSNGELIPMTFADSEVEKVFPGAKIYPGARTLYLP